ncbi:sulfite exporter TauE/SafE family protein [Thermithiobacillus plumbiphilus]|uniref:Sulfite exporter TauE/SafE family protein n=1 Tax=Thermithiobacillus plumbiphilus TaxID=1729899 RepID=A0ABU9D7F7_9PROT
MEITNQFPLLAAFIVGLLGGVHCVGMCGGIVGMLSFSLPPAIRSDPWKQFPYLLGYNAGRIFSYSMAGLIAGGLGALAAGILPVRAAQVLLFALAALVMIALGLYLAGMAPMVSRIEHLGRPLWRRLEPVSRKLLPVKSPGHAMLLGTLWGWLPCGLVYSALIMAVSAGSALQGGLLMLAFGLGTLPTVLTMGSLAGLLTQWTRRPQVRRVAGLLIAGMGVLSLMMLASKLIPSGAGS